MLKTPGLAISILLALVYGTAFHLWGGRSIRDLPIYWLAALLGFAAGHLLGQKLDPIPWTLGQVHIVEATAGAFLFLVIVRWLRGGKKPT
jgi:hypothetical protein